MALNKLRMTDQPPTGSDAMTSAEKQRLDMIEVLSRMPVIRDVAFVVYFFIKKTHVEYASPNMCCTNSLGGQAETIECRAHERFASDRRPNAEKTA